MKDLGCGMICLFFIIDISFSLSLEYFETSRVKVLCALSLIVFDFSKLYFPFLKWDPACLLSSAATYFVSKWNSFDHKLYFVSWIFDAPLCSHRLRNQFIWLSCRILRVFVYVCCVFVECESESEREWVFVFFVGICVCACMCVRYKEKIFSLCVFFVYCSMYISGPGISNPVLCMSGKKHRLI